MKNALRILKSRNISTEITELLSVNFNSFDVENLISWTINFSYVVFFYVLPKLVSFWTFHVFLVLGYNYFSVYQHASKLKVVVSLVIMKGAAMMLVFMSCQVFSDVFSSERALDGFLSRDRQAYVSFARSILRQLDCRMGSTDRQPTNTPGFHLREDG